MKFSEKHLIRTGLFIIAAGGLLLFLPLPQPLALTGLLLIGLGCSPVFPNMLQLTPQRFGAENSQKIIGFQMAGAYTGSAVLPPLTGFILANTTMTIMPLFIILDGLGMLILTERLNVKYPGTPKGITDK
jgi:fucose permease